MALSALSGFVRAALMIAVRRAAASSGSAAFRVVTCRAPAGDWPAPHRMALLSAGVATP